MRRIKTIAKCTTALILGTVCLPDVSIAQTSEEADEPVEEVADQEDERTLDRIQVTGSLLYRDAYASTSPIEIITTDDAVRQGLRSAADMIQSSTLALSAPQRNETFQSTQAAGGLGIRTVDLRGCGDSRTLVLVNGKRPGESGYSGGVPAFNLSHLPVTAIDRIEVLKDSGSTIYGSDAICGVVNVITKNSISGFELNLDIIQPFESGGEATTISAGYGFELNSNAKFTLSAEYSFTNELDAGDRDYLRCREDYVTDPETGLRADRLNYSATATDPNNYCHNLGHYSILDLLTGELFIPTQDGSTVPSPSFVAMPGFEPLSTASLVSADGVPVYRAVDDAPFLSTTDIRPQNEHFSVFGTSDFTFDNAINWRTQALFTRGKSVSDGWRVFAPTVGSASAPAGGGGIGGGGIGGGGIGGGGVGGGSVGGGGAASAFSYPANTAYANSAGRPVIVSIPFPTAYDATNEFFFLSSSLSGGYGDYLSSWSWNVDAVYNQASTTTSTLQILASKSGDLADDGRDIDGDGETDFIDPPTLDYLSADLLSGAGVDQLVDAIGAVKRSTGNYSQMSLTAITSGEMMKLPAGPVQVAIGAEYREHEIETRPDGVAKAGGYHLGDQETDVDGSNTIVEVFAEAEIPLIKSQPLAEDVFLNASIRAFDYEFGGSDYVYKLGLNWQITPTVRARASHGTSYAAPSLFDQVRTETSSYHQQFLIDPCVNWGLSTNENVRANCAAEGIPDDFSGLGSTIEQVRTIEPLDPEESTSYSAGIVFTPTWSDLSVAVDYYDIKIENEITDLTVTQIFGGCYRAQSFPNDFCAMLGRDSATADTPFAISRIETPKINLHSQNQRGVDLNIRYRKQLNLGDLDINTTISQSLERSRSVFGDEFDDGLVELDRNGQVGFPEVTASSTISFTRQDWTYSWFTQYLSKQDNGALVISTLPDVDGSGLRDYFGNLVRYKYHTEAQFTHGASIGWRGDTWSFTGGVRNLFDEAPPKISETGAVLYGRHDVLGRRVFASVSKRF